MLFGFALVLVVVLFSVLRGRESSLDFRKKFFHHLVRSCVRVVFVRVAELSSIQPLLFGMQMASMSSIALKKRQKKAAKKIRYRLRTHRSSAKR